MSQQSVNGPGWTPAPKPGLIPLRPLGFGTILGKSFAVLRHNPKVLFGFAVIVQLLAMVVVASVVAGVSIVTLNRLDTVPRGSDEWTTLLFGSIAIIGLAGLLMGLFSAAFSAIVQGVVAADVRAAVLSEPATLRALWARVRPAAWRLIGYTLLYGTATVLAVLLVTAVAVGAIAAPTGFQPAGVGLAVVAALVGMLGVVVLAIWIGTKLMLVPSLLVLEGATLRDGIARSWRLTRGRFWFAFGIVFIIGLILYVASQAVGMIGGLFTSIIGPVLNPTGQGLDALTAGSLVALIITELVVIVLQSISAVVQATANALIYVDCRMRYEGLDQDLMAATERRAAGDDDGPDPFRVGLSRAVPRGFRPVRITPAFPAPGYPAPGYPADPAPQGYAPQGYAPQGYAPQGYAPQGYAPQGYPAPATRPMPPAAPFAPPPPATAPPAPPPTAPAPESPWAPPSGEDPWAPPGSPGR